MHWQENNDRYKNEKEYTNSKLNSLENRNIQEDIEIFNKNLQIKNLEVK